MVRAARRQSSLVSTPVTTSDGTSITSATPATESQTNRLLP